MYRVRLNDLARRSLIRRLRTIDSAATAEVEIEGQKVLLLSSNNYLDLATHPKVTEAAIAAIQRYGVGAAASRLISGTLRPHTELEARLAAFKRVEAALVFSTGYQANLGLMPVVSEECSAIYADRLCHASLIDAARVCDSPLRVYRHRDTAQLQRLLEKTRSSLPVLIITDGVFSMDGDLAPLPKLLALAEAHLATLVVDDAHGTGVMGPEGRGTVEHFGLEGRGIVQMGTLSKALGGFGGFVAGSRDLIEYLVNRSRTLIYTTALPPGLAAAACAALDVVETEPERRSRLWTMRQRLCAGLQELGCDTLHSESPILPILVGEAEAAVRLSEHLLAYGIYAPAIRPPTVPAGTSRIRMSVTAGHSSPQIDRVLETLALIKNTDGALWEQLTNRKRAAKEAGVDRHSPAP